MSSMREESKTVSWKIDYEQIKQPKELRQYLDALRLSSPATWSDIASSPSSISSTQIGGLGNKLFWDYRSEAFVAHRAALCTMKTAESGSLDDCYGMIISKKVQLFGIYFELCRVRLEKLESWLSQNKEISDADKRATYKSAGDSIEEMYQLILPMVLEADDNPNYIIYGLNAEAWRTGEGSKHLIYDSEHAGLTNSVFMQDVAPVDDEYIPSAKYGKPYSINVSPRVVDGNLRHYPADERHFVVELSLDMPYIEFAEAPNPTLTENPTRKLIASKDYQSLSWDGHKYQLRSRNQGAIIEYLYEQFKAESSSLHQAVIIEEALGEKVGNSRKRLDSFFRTGEAKRLWDDGLIRADGDGFFSLNISE